MTGQALRLFVENLLVKMHFDKRTSADGQQAGRHFADEHLSTDIWQTGN